jgi:hypothetical protein
VEWLVPWYSVGDDPAHVAGMERELQGVALDRAGMAAFRDITYLAAKPGT